MGTLHEMIALYLHGRVLTVLTHHSVPICDLSFATKQNKTPHLAVSITCSRTRQSLTHGSCKSRCAVWADVEATRARGVERRVQIPTCAELLPTHQSPSGPHLCHIWGPRWGPHRPPPYNAFPYFPWLVPVSQPTAGKNQLLLPRQLARLQGTSTAAPRAKDLQSQTSQPLYLNYLPSLKPK